MRVKSRYFDKIYVFFIVLWQVWTTILATLPHGDCMYQLSFQGTSFWYSLIQLCLFLVEICNPNLNFGWTFYFIRQRRKEFCYYLFYICKSWVLDYWQTLTTDECLSADKIEFDILSNEILKKGPAQADRSLYTLYQSDIYSSTAACAAANGNWLSALYGESGKHLGNIMSIYCTFCTRFPQNIRPFLPLRLLISIF